jgi:precorrin-6B C5,15-methyltransferase / cobalt-precorrin-6B C5,C15-methyltransferase
VKATGDVTVIGYDGSLLNAAARAALDEATLVVGGARHLAAVGVPGGASLLVLGNLDDALTGISAHRGPVCVVASGDPGFFGIVRVLRERGFAVRVHPVASSVASAFAAVGLPWDDAVVVSAHGRELRSAVNVCRAFPKVAVLTGPGSGAREIGSALLGTGRTVVVAQRLGETDERVESVSPETAASRDDWLDPHVVITLDERRVATERGWMAGWNGVPGRWALPETDFEHRDSMITKSEVRAVVLSRLAPRPGTLIWDVGAGSGSVGIECARLGAAVFAVERDSESCDRIAANAIAHNVDVTVVRGQVPAVLAGLPEADAVFVGGGGADAIAACAESSARTVVVALAAIERVAETIQQLAKNDRDVDGLLIQVSRLAALPGDTHRFAATNPVFLLWGERL